MQSITFSGEVVIRDDASTDIACLKLPKLNKWLAESGVTVIHVAQSQTLIPQSHFLYGSVRFVVTIFYEA